MDNTLMTIIGIFIAATLIFVMPLMTVSERNDDIAQSVVQTATAEFVDKISISGVIKPSDYEEYEQKLSSTGNIYEIEIEVQHLDENIGKKDGATSKDLIGENERYSTFTTEILSNMYEEDGESKNYVLKKGDNVIITAKNTNKTMAQTLRSFIYKVTGQGTYQVVASSSSMVVNNGDERQYLQTATKVTKQKIERWEQRQEDKKIIDGKTQDGTVVTTVQIGDYINYDCTSGEQNDSYTSEAVNTGLDYNQTFNTNSDIKWRVIGVENNQLILTSESPTGIFVLRGETGYNNGVDELNKISSIYADGFVGTSARHMNAQDVINLFNSYNKYHPKLNDYGNGTEIFGIYCTNEQEANYSESYKNYVKIEFTECDNKLIELIFSKTSGRNMDC